MSKFPIDISICIGESAGDFVAYEASTTSVSFTNTSNSTFWRAFTYTVPSGTLYRADFKLKRTGTVTGNFSTQIRTTSAGVPTSTIIGSSTNAIDPSTLSTSDPTDFNNSFFYSDLSVSGTIAVVFNVGSVTFSASSIDFGRLNPVDSAVGKTTLSTNSGVSWGALNDFQGQIRFWYR